MFETIAKSWTRLYLLVAALLLSACVSPPERPAEPVELASTFSQTGETRIPEATGAWWTAFEDHSLNQLVERALGDNFSLRASYQRLLQARAVADRQGAELWPSLDATASAERQESDTGGTDVFRAGLSASYEVDLWGRVQAVSAAEELRASATLADYQAAAVSLSGEIATTWFQLSEQRAQLALAQSQLEINQKILAVIESRFAMGQSDSADVLRQRQLVSTSRERLSSVIGEISVLQNQVAVLTGQSPGQARVPDDGSLPALPSLPDTGVPATLVRRRPDLQQAWLAVQAADRDLAAAISNRFPRISIEASVSSQAGDASELFDNWLVTFAGNLVAPLVDGGQRRAEVRRSEAVLAALVHEYGQAVLIAIREVEDALAREQQQKQRLKSLEQQIRYAESAYRQLRNQYLNGAVSYIEVLSALQDTQELQRSILNSRQQLLTNRVALYRALAGSIETEPAREATETRESNDS